MKIRNGFVSNSSSSSFLILSKNMPVPNKTSKYGKYISLDVVDEHYNRNRNEVIRSIEDKLRLITTLYSLNYSNWHNFKERTYMKKMNEFTSKVNSLGEKYGYRINITAPPVFFYKDKDYDENDNPIDSGKIGKEIRVETEWWDGVSLIKRIVEDSDTSRLENILFNNESFFIVGGDEYEKNYRLQYIERKRVEKEGYDYEVLGNETNDSWGTYEPYYINGKVPEYDCYANDAWDDTDDDYNSRYCQRNLPFDYDLDEALKTYDD